MKKITLREKKERQRIIINELFASLEEVPIDQDEYLENFFYGKIKELFKIELDYYGVKCLQENPEDNEMEISFKYEDDDVKWSASFDKKVIVGSDHYQEHGTQGIRFNTNSRAYKELFFEDKEKRLTACRYIIFTLFHELEHYRQNELCRSGISSYAALKYAKDDLFLSIHNDVYYDNHDRMASEADSHYYARKEYNGIIPLDKFEYNNMIVQLCNREMQNIAVEGIGLVERDNYIRACVDYYLTKEQYAGNLMYYPILAKEYNENCTPKSITDLITNFYVEIDKVNRTVKNPRTRNILIRDIKSLYFEILNTKVRENDRFELYEAIKFHGQDTIQKTFNDLRLYNINEKKRKIGIVNKKQQAYKKMLTYYTYTGSNPEYIINPFKKGNEVTKASDFASFISFDFRVLSSRIRDRLQELFKSEQFIYRIPVYGHYVLKNGEKISIMDFLYQYAIPLLERCKNEDDLFKKYMEIAMEYLKPYCEVDAAYSLKAVNKQYKEYDKKVNNILSSSLVNDPKELNRLNTSYNEIILYRMKYVKMICNKEVSIYSDPCDESVSDKTIIVNHLNGPIFMLSQLMNAAQLLSTDLSLNPNKINYYEKLNNHKKIKDIKKEMERLRKL